MKDQTSLDQDLHAIFASDPTAIANPFPVWNRLRETAAAYPCGDYILFPHHADISAIFRDQRFLSNAKGQGSQFQAIWAKLHGEERVALEEVTAFEANYVSRSNGEPHARLRRIAQRAFAPQRIAQMRERVQWHTDDLLDSIAHSGSFDLKPLAFTLPVRIIGELLEIPSEDLEQIRIWSDALGYNRDNSNTAALMASHKAMEGFRDYVQDMIKDVRLRGGKGGDEKGLVALFMDAEQDERLSAIELTAMFVVLLFAGHETTTNLIANGALQLMNNGDLPALAADPALTTNAVEELLRFVSPVQFIGRVAETDIDWAGTKIAAGQTIQLILAAANRDPRVFTNPDTLDIRRTDARQHIGFGLGQHFCIGFQLARLEAVVALGTLARRYPDLQVAASELEWGGHAKLRTLRELPVQSLSIAA